MCKEGHYGEGEGNTRLTCEGQCDAGHWCSAGSSSRTQNECGGSGFYCPKGSFTPTPVSPGYYTAPGAIDLEIRYGRDQKNNTMSVQRVCEVSVRKLRRTSHVIVSRNGDLLSSPLLTGRSSQPGYYCKNGMKYHCDSGSWSNDWGMRDQSNCDTCEEGHYCESHPLQPSTSATQKECGGVALYCPAGSR